MAEYTQKKREYDRQRAKKVYEDFKNRRLKIIEKLGGECYLCAKKQTVGLHLHHTNYHNEESNYPRHSKSMYVRLKRLVEAELHPERFRLLCSSCHPLLHQIERFLKNKNLDISKIKELLPD